MIYGAEGGSLLTRCSHTILKAIKVLHHNPLYQFRIFNHERRSLEDKEAEKGNVLDFGSSVQPHDVLEEAAFPQERVTETAEEDVCLNVWNAMALEIALLSIEPKGN
jgi:hypothetical protein